MQQIKARAFPCFQALLIDRQASLAFLVISVRVSWCEQVYGGNDGWPFLEEDSYRVVQEALFEKQEQEDHQQQPHPHPQVLLLLYFLLLFISLLMIILFIHVLYFHFRLSTIFIFATTYDYQRISSFLIHYNVRVFINTYMQQSTFIKKLYFSALPIVTLYPASSSSILNIIQLFLF